MLDTYNVNFSRISQEILQAQINPHLANNPWKQPKIKYFLVFQEGQKKNNDQIWVNKVSNTLVALLFCKADGIWEGEQRRIRTLSKFYDGAFFVKLVNFKHSR